MIFFLERKEQTTLTHSPCARACPMITRLALCRKRGPPCVWARTSAGRKRLLQGSCPICRWRGSEGRCSDEALTPWQMFRRCSRPLHRVASRCQSKRTNFSKTQPSGGSQTRQVHKSSSASSGMERGFVRATFDDHWVNHKIGRSFVLMEPASCQLKHSYTTQPFGMICTSWNEAQEAT